ncbi:hypothetical protein [Halorubrum sp. N11]|uniref:hypothetical protein n=1 Tax=Halorubrum sp. N11 TaxID=3402276 RepID=UPI003EB6A065
MTGTPSSIHDSQSESTSTQPGSDKDSSGSRLLALADVGITLLSIALSSFAHGFLPEQMRIHWTLGLGPYYGPEFVPTLVVLIAFPVIIAGIALGTYWLDARLQHIEEFAAIRPYYTVIVVGTLSILLASQGALIVATM